MVLCGSISEFVMSLPSYHSAFYRFRKHHRSRRHSRMARNGDVHNLKILMMNGMNGTGHLRLYSTPQKRCQGSHGIARVESLAMASKQASSHSFLRRGNEAMARRDANRVSVQPHQLLNYGRVLFMS